MGTLLRPLREARSGVTSPVIRSPLPLQVEAPGDLSQGPCCTQVDDGRLQNPRGISPGPLDAPMLGGHRICFGIEWKWRGGAGACPEVELCEAVSCIFSGSHVTTTSKARK